MVRFGQAATAPDDVTGMAKTSLMIVEDEPELRSLLAKYMEREGYGVSVASSVQELQRSFIQNAPDMMILDIGLPDGDGWDVLRWVRGRSHIPVLMLTGRNDAVDRVVGLELGADDYLGKPFVLREVLARLRAIQRRHDYGAAESLQRHESDPRAPGALLSAATVAPQASAARPSPPRALRPKPVPASPLRIRGLEVDVKGRELRDANGAAIKLTHAEFSILILLARAEGQVVTRDRLMQEVAGRDWDPSDRSIDVHVSNLRRKLETGADRQNLIRAVRGAGYMLVETED